MRKTPMLYGLGCLMLIFSCNNLGESQKEVSSIEAVAKAVEHYYLSELKTGKVSYEKGTVSAVDSAFKYLSELKEVVYGRIDSDTLTDAILPVRIFQGQTPVRVEHIVLLRSGNDFNFAAGMNKIYKIRKIEDNAIIAEYTDLPFDSPIYGCTECIRVYKYRLVGTELIKIDSLKY